jgi:hypothetical protein
MGRSAGPEQSGYSGCFILKRYKRHARHIRQAAVQCPVLYGMNRGLKNLDPDRVIRQGRVLGGESKTIPDGGYAKLTLMFFKANGVPILRRKKF